MPYIVGLDDPLVSAVESSMTVIVMGKFEDVLLKRLGNAQSFARLLVVLVLYQVATKNER